MDDKQSIRKRILAQRRELRVSDYLRKCAAITRHLCGIPQIDETDVLLTYVSSKDNEVDTWAVIQWAWHRGKQVLVPKTAPDRALTWHRITQWTDLERGPFGIFEPRADRTMARNVETLHAPVLVPGIAFTRTGFRIGYGAGYFDRFLQSYKGVFVGLAFDFQIIDAFPIAPHDVPMHQIVTESEVIYCR